MSQAGADAGRSEVRRAALAALLLGLFWSVPMAPERAWGWDESMHAELPAVRMLLAAQDGELGAALGVLHDCGQYPFLWPLALACVQSISGVSELACRVAGTWAWCFALFGLFLLGRELVAAQRGPDGAARRGDDLAPWLAMGLGALCPLALAYSGTLFLEVPFAAVSVWSLRAWLRRDGRPSRELSAGAWLAAAFFTKFNYALLLAFGCSLDWAVEGALAARRGGLIRHLLRGAWLAAIPGLALLWWLVLPLPAGSEVAARHREALLDFLGGNLDLAPTPWGVRALHWAAFFALTARLLALQLAGAAAALREVARPGARLLWLVLLGAGLPVWLHPFHLDRFLIPSGPALWALAALGLARALPAAPGRRGAALAAFGLLALAFPGLDARLVSARLCPAPASADIRASQLQTFRGWRELGPRRPLPTGPSLARAERDRLLDLVAAAVGPGERLGWLGLSSELSPAAVHLGLFARAGSRQRFRRDAHRPMDVALEGADPGWDDARLQEFASGFDAILVTSPPDLRERAARAFIRGYQERLVGTLGWQAASVGTIELSRPGRDPLPVRVYLCRPPQR